MSNQPGRSHPETRAIDVATSAFFAIAIYNCVEMYLLMFSMFRRKNTAYFWTMFVANTGIVMHESFVFRFLDLLPALPIAVLTSVAWFLMTTGQSFVLYLRLHLVVGDRRKIRWILFLIIFSVITLQIPTATIFIGLRASPPDRDSNFRPAFDVFTLIQICGFLLQDCVIMGLYVFAFNSTSKRLRMIRGDGARKILNQLVALAILTVLLDVALVVNAIVGDFRVQTTLKSANYSIKLKAELFILNNLVSYIQTPSTPYESLPPNREVQPQAPLCRLSSGHTDSSEPPLCIPSSSVGIVGSKGEIDVLESRKRLAERKGAWSSS